MTRQCILLANASVARLFTRATPTDPLVVMETLAHPQSRLKGQQLGDDRPGHEAVDGSSGGNRFEPRSDVRRKEHQRFAREIARRLDRGLTAGEFDSLWIFASNPFLGELKAEFGDAVGRCVRLALDTDLSSLGLPEIEHRLRDVRLTTQ